MADPKETKNPQGLTAQQKCQLLICPLRNLGNLLMTLIDLIKLRTRRKQSKKYQIYSQGLITDFFLMDI